MVIIIQLANVRGLIRQGYNMQIKYHLAYCEAM